MQELEARADDLVAALDGLPTAGFLLTATRKIACMNRQAEDLLTGPIPIIRIPWVGQRALEALAIPPRPRYVLRSDTDAHARVLLLVYDPERRPTMLVGLVSLPGMMTSQTLVGTKPIEAVTYQILIIFMIACAAAMGGITLCLLAFRISTHLEHRNCTPYGGRNFFLPLLSLDFL